MGSDIVNLDVDTASGVAKALGGGGPKISRVEAVALVADLRAQAARAPEIVHAISGMDTASVEDVPVRVVDRGGWARAAARSVALMMPQDPKGEETGRIGRVGMSAGMGIAMGFLGRNILGQYIPFENHLLVVAPNIAHFQRQYGLDRQDLALWVSTHELTHAAQFSAAPWMADYLAERAAEMVETAEEDPISFSLEDGVGAEVTALMSLLEGHAEYVMNQVPRHLLPSRKRLMEAMVKRRTQAGFLRKQATKQLGMDEKAKQYATGGGFVSQVVDARGHEGLNAVWERSENLPTLSEIRDPSAWIARVLG